MIKDRLLSFWRGVLTVLASVLVVCVWIASGLYYLSGCLFRFALGFVGLALILWLISPSCDKCGYSAVWPFYSVGHRRTPCADSTAEVTEGIRQCIALAQPCVIRYHNKWRKVRPYRLGPALRGLSDPLLAHDLLRALECSVVDGQEAWGYRTYRLDEVKLLARLPLEPPYRFEPQCYGKDNTIGEPMITAPTPEAIGAVWDDIKAKYNLTDTRKKD